MIDKEKIFEEAENVYDEKFLNDTYGTIYFDNGDQEEAHTPNQVREAFVRGAEWAQQEFVKDVWHDASEEPEMDKLYIVYTENVIPWHEDGKPPIRFESFHCFHFTPKGWDGEISYKGHTCTVKYWAYIDDILPKKGGEE